MNDGRKMLCGHCSGTGWAPLSRPMARTLDWLTKQERPVSVAEVAKAMRTKQPAAANRLETLRNAGLVMRTDRKARPVEGQRKCYLWVASDLFVKLARARGEGRDG